MSNQVTANGIEIDSMTDTVASLKAAFANIYGADADLSDNSPDGQLINCFAQVVQDELDLTVSMFSSFDPDQAFGRTLDQRVAINGIKRQSGTYSTTDVTVVVSGPVNLVGLDGAAPENAPAGLFIVADGAGNRWALVNSFAVGASGTYTLVFSSLTIGAIKTIPGTITSPITAVTGLVSVVNTASQLSTGVPEESDFDLRNRRRKSLSITSQGFYASMKAQLLNVPGVTYAEVFENNTGTIDSNGIPGHSVWVIIGGTASNTDIANAIYMKRSAGCGMRGTIAVSIIRPNGPAFVVRWDDVQAEPLYVKFTPDFITGNIVVDGTTHGTTTIDGILSTVGIAAGHPVRGTGIPLGTVVVSVATNSIMISHVATNSTTESITIVPVVASDLATAISEAFVSSPHEMVNINAIATLVQSINPNLVLTDLGLSSNGTDFYSVLSTSALNYQFTLIAGNIKIT